MGLGMSIYDDMRGVAQDLLTDFNQGTIQIERTAITPSASLADDDSTAAPVVYTGKGAAKGFSDDKIDGEQIRIGDLEVTISAASLSINPDVRDVCIIDSVRYEIQSVSRVPAAGTIIVHKLHVGKR